MSAKFGLLMKLEIVLRTLDMYHYSSDSVKHLVGWKMGLGFTAYANSSDHNDRGQNTPPNLAPEWNIEGKDWQLMVLEIILHQVGRSIHGMKGENMFCTTPKMTSHHFLPLMSYYNEIFLLF